MMNTSENIMINGLPVPIQYYLLDPEKQKEIIEYLLSMDELQKKAYLIAKEHLGTSFNIFKSNGYVEWKKA